ncbi:hypothetical protein RRF57_010774 [Xylaria bambusicola]|uniref:Uncharacterized protein n=1 Tax=Xylaria bambusicola TaxID=326684 RepID=A0AAN7Z9Q1_9PEZI
MSSSISFCVASARTSGSCASPAAPVKNALLWLNNPVSSPPLRVRMTWSRYANTIPGAVSYESVTFFCLSYLNFPPISTGSIPAGGPDSSASMENLEPLSFVTVNDDVAIRSPETT